MNEQEHREQLERPDLLYLFLRKILWLAFYAMIFTWVIVVAASGKV